MPGTLPDLLDVLWPDRAMPATPATTHAHRNCNLPTLSPTRSACPATPDRASIS